MAVRLSIRATVTAGAGDNWKIQAVQRPGKSAKSAPTVTSLSSATCDENIRLARTSPATPVEVGFLGLFVGGVTHNAGCMLKRPADVQCPCLAGARIVETGAHDSAPKAFALAQASAI
jgi:hypothetical protein